MSSAPTPARRSRNAEILIGEPDAVGYDALQDELGNLIHRNYASVLADR